MTQAYNLSEFANRINTSGQVNPDNLLTTFLPVNQGGFGVNTITAGSLILGNGTSAIQTVSPSTIGGILTSNGTTWQSVANSYIGVQQTWQDVTASRTFATAYQNTTGKPIMVAFSYAPASSTSLPILIEIDNTGSGTWVSIARMVAQNEFDINGSAYSFIVPNGAYYRITKGSTEDFNTLFWTELR